MGVKIDDPRRDSETIDVEHTVSRRLDSTNLFDAPIADRNITDERRHAGTVVNASAFENQVVHVFTSNGLIWRSTFHTAGLFDCARLYGGKPRRATIKKGISPIFRAIFLFWAAHASEASIPTLSRWPLSSANPHFRRDALAEPTTSSAPTL